MKSTFLSHEQVFEKPLRALKALGAAAPASDLARMTAVDDGFLTEDTGGINYYLAGGKTVDRFGRSDPCAVCAVRPVILLEELPRRNTAITPPRCWTAACANLRRRA